MKFRFALPFAAFLSISSAPAPVSAAPYKIDQDHSTVGFRIHHLLSWVHGTFNAFEGTFEYDPENPAVWKAQMSVQAASIDTRNEARDKHLRSPDFFDAEKFPALTFESTEITEVTANSAKLHGNLTLHGVTKPVVFDLEIHGVANDPWGNTRASFSAKTKVARADFGITWNEALETGGVLLGEEVEITVEVEGILTE